MVLVFALVVFYYKAVQMTCFFFFKGIQNFLMFLRSIEVVGVIMTVVWRIHTLDHGKAI